MKSGEQKATSYPPERILQLLSHGEIEVNGLVPWSSNTTLLVTVRDPDLSVLAIYKPQRGERPLWDFPYGSLGMREVAAYLVSEALGWDLVPPTVLRRGPHGLGSMQFFVRAEEDAHFFTIQGEKAYTHDLQRLAVFDVIANNADRKAGHCLIDEKGRLWAIDNALTFHTEPKLRTVIWDYAGEPLPGSVLADLEALSDVLRHEKPLRKELRELLSRSEVSALRRRVHRLIQEGCFPEPGPGRPVPWPLI